MGEGTAHVAPKTQPMPLLERRLQRLLAVTVIVLLAANAIAVMALSGGNDAGFERVIAAGDAPPSTATATTETTGASGGGSATAEAPATAAPAPTAGAPATDPATTTPPATTLAAPTTAAPTTSGAPTTARPNGSGTTAPPTTSASPIGTLPPAPSATPAPAPPRTRSSAGGRIAHGPGRLREATTTFGPAIGEVPKGWISANLDRGAPEKAVSVVENLTREARERGVDNVVVSVPLAWQRQGARRDPDGSLAAMRAVGRGEHDAVYAGIARALVDGGFPSAVLRLGHEHNMLWAPWYSGDGRADDFVAAWRRAADRIRAAAPGVALDWNIGASGADPDSDSGATFDPASWPGDEYVDIVGRDLYCRSNGRKPEVTRRALEEHAAFAAAHGKPVSYPEVGITLPHPGQSAGNTVGSDEVCAEFIDIVLGFAQEADLAYFVWWASQREDQGYRYRPTPEDQHTWRALHRHFG